MIRPQLILTQPERQRSTVPTWEQRQGYRDRNGAIIPEREAVRMSVAELIAFMGASYVNHPEYKQRSSMSLVTPENLAGKQPVIQHCDCGLWGQIKAVFFWGLR